MTVESVNPSQELQALLDSLNGKTFNAISSRFQMLENASAVDELARRYRELRIKLERTTKLEERMLIRRDPIYLAADRAAGGYVGTTSKTVRGLLVDRYGFTVETVGAFDQNEAEANRALNNMFFDLFAYVYANDDKDYGREFTRPRAKGSYVDRIITGDYEGVLQHLKSRPGQQST